MLRARYPAEGGGVGGGGAGAEMGMDGDSRDELEGFRDQVGVVWCAEES